MAYHHIKKPYLLWLVICDVSAVPSIQIWYWAHHCPDVMETQCARHCYKVYTSKHTIHQLLQILWWCIMHAYMMMHKKLIKNLGTNYNWIDGFSRNYYNNYALDIEAFTLDTIMLSQVILRVVLKWLWRKTTLAFTSNLWRGHVYSITMQP